MNFSIFKHFFTSDNLWTHTDPRKNCLITQIGIFLLYTIDNMCSEIGSFNILTLAIIPIVSLQHMLFSSEDTKAIAKTLNFVILITVTPISRHFFTNGIFISCTLSYILPLIAVYQGEGIKKTFALCLSQIFYFYYICRTDLEPMIIYQEQFQFFKIISTQMYIVLLVIMSLTLQIKRREIALMAKYNEMNQKVKLLLGSIHDLRNSAGILIGNIDLCPSEALSQAASQAIENAKYCSEILIYLTNNLLDLGKSDLRSLEINKRFVDLRDIFLKNWRTCQTLLKRKSLQGGLYVTNLLPSFIEIDSYRLSQVLFNIMSNSEKYTDKGSIVISVDWIPNVSEITNEIFEPLPYDEDGIFDKLFSTMPMLDDFQLLGTEKYSGTGRSSFIESGTNSGMLKITWKDTGAGISKEKIQNLFRLYSQVSEDMSKRQMGSGLGLYITSKIIKSLNGDIRCYSKLGMGTTFIACIPCKCRAQL